MPALLSPVRMTLLAKRAVSAALGAALSLSLLAAPLGSALGAEPAASASAGTRPAHPVPAKRHPASAKRPPAHAKRHPTSAKRHARAHRKTVIEQHGKATFYADKFHGRKTASGETFHQGDLTAASSTLPLGTKVTVTNRENGKSVEVRVNDRKPPAEGKVIDLSKRAAAKLGIKKKDGVAPVTVQARPANQSTPELKSAVERLATKTE